MVRGLRTYWSSRERELLNSSLHWVHRYRCELELSFVVLWSSFILPEEAAWCFRAELEAIFERCERESMDEESRIWSSALSSLLSLRR